MCIIDQYKCTYGRSDVDEMRSDRRMLELYADDRGCRTMTFVFHEHGVSSRNQRSVESGAWKLATRL